MNGNLIDTNIIIKLLNGYKNTESIFDSLEKVCVSAVKAGELFYGACKSSRVQDNIKLFKSFLLEYSLLDITQEVSEIYGEIKFQFFNKA
jgi:tRNA(fMet)-specific endonuclease VapC